MSSNTPNRSFGFGCRETPDFYDKFLERLGYYRKHVATDSSSLFRVVSELRYDIQLYHEKVRAECVQFMSKNKALFVKEIRYGYESYVKNIARSRTYGSLLELRALALLHKVNVFLFEPCTEGKWYMYNSKYTVTWRVFIGRDNHFDVVYPLDYIKAAATSQAIVYQILYSKVLNLPDVEYAVERMLHDPEGKLMKYEKNQAGTTVATTEDGLRLELSKPGRSTQCVLMYSHLCHFHNQTNFPAIERFFMDHGPAEGCRMYLNSTFRVGPFKPNPLLRESNISCVRQLLAIDITPFPYKAAKSLDPNIYRNVEYDVWQEVRADRLDEMLGNEKKINEDKHGKRAFKHVNPLKIIKNEVKYAITTGVSEPEATEPTCLETDSPLTIAPYPLQSIYFPTPDQYGINTMVIPSDANNLTFADTIGVSGCICNHFTSPSPMQFHTPSPLPQLQPAPPTPAPGNDPLAVPDLITLVPHTLNHQPMQSEYVMMFDSLYPSPQQQQQPPTRHLPYLHQSSQQQQQQQHHQSQHHLYHPQQPHEQEQQQQLQQINPQFLPRCLFHCVPNGTDANTGSTLSITYDSNPYTTLPSSPASPGFWHM